MLSAAPGPDPVVFIPGFGGSFTSADEQFYYVPADSPIKTMKDAEGKTISISTNGSASNMFALHLARHFGVNLKPQPTGAYAATLTATVLVRIARDEAIARVEADIGRKQSHRAAADAFFRKP